MFKKLFAITYNNKKFLILVDENHRKTFLEVASDGKYIYPTYEDYLALYDIYNNHNYDILCDLRKLSYKEAVKYKLGVLLVAAGIYGFCLGSAIKADVDAKTLNISYTQQVKEVSRDSETLAQLYGNDWITRDDVIRVINENDNLSERYKQIAIETMDNLLSLDSNVNLRIYYENMKDVKITELTYDELVKKINASAAGCYFRQSNEIYLTTEYLGDYAIAAHEFTHSAFSLSDVIDGQRIVIGDDFGYSLNEAMTQRIIANKWGNNGAYDLQQVLLDFFLTNMTDFKYHTYNEESIIGIIDDLKAEYPDVDIDYLIDFIDTLTTSQQTFKDIQNICEVPEFSDELFKIAIKNINRNVIYQSFNSFMEIFKENMDIAFYNKYFDLYNKELISQGFITETIYNQVNSIDSLCLVGDNFYLGNANTYFNCNGNTMAFNMKMLTLPINEYGRTKLLQDAVLGNEIYNWNYIHDLLVDENLLDYPCVKYIRNLEDTNKKLLIDGIFNYMSKSIDKDNLYGEFDNFALFLAFDYELYKEYYNYLSKYDLIVSKLCDMDSNMIEDIRNIKCLVRYNNMIYPCINSDATNRYNYTIWRDSNDIGTEYTKVHFGDSPTYSYVSDTGIYKDIIFTDKAIDYFLLSEAGVNSIIQYAADNKIDNIWQVDEINKLFNTFGIGNIEKTLTFEEKAINMDDYYVAFGLYGGNVGIILYDKDDNYIYGTCGCLQGNICYLPLKTFVKLGDGFTTNWEKIEWLISNEYLRSIPNIALEYLVPNVNVRIENVESRDLTGNITHDNKKIIELTNYQQIMVNGIKDYARHIYLYTDDDSNIKIHFFDEDMVLGNLRDENNTLWFPINSYFIFFDKCLAYYNMLYDDSFSKEQVIEIFENYAKDIYLKANRKF